MGKLSNNVSREIIHHGSINIWLTTAVPFRKWLRFPRGDLEPPRIRCGVSTLPLLPRRSLRHLLQSTARK